MIEIALATRFLVDIFWTEKWMSIVHSAVFALFAVLVIVKREGLTPKLRLADGFVAVFIGLTTYSFLLDPSEENVPEVLKFFAFFLFYALGRIAVARGAFMRQLAWISFSAISMLAVAAILGSGYEEWGSTNTFTGGYYFKTDAALACLVFLAIVSVEFESKFLLRAALVLSLFVVFKTNARIALPLVFAVPLCCRHFAGAGKKRTSALIFKLGIGLGVGVLAAAGLVLLNPTLLSFDLSDPLSVENTQGRSMIWLALLRAFSENHLLAQLFGSGLSADRVATNLFAEDAHAEFRAHNSYLYLLLAVGVAGLSTYIIILSSMVKNLRFAARSAMAADRKWAALLAAIALISVVMSFTVETVVRPQITLPLFMIYGAVVSIRSRFTQDPRARSLQAKTKRQIEVQAQALLHQRPL